MMRIGVVGGGVVGSATARCFMEWAEVRVYDVVAERATHALGEVLNSDLVFVALPTPQRDDGMEADVGALDKFFGGVMGCHDVNFVLRSTVPIGTTRRLREKYELPNLIHSPEFLTARCAFTDIQVPARNIVGGLQGGGQPNSYFSLRDLYEKRFPGVPVLTMSSDESEAVKLILNGFFATKVAYFNEVFTLVEKLDMDWQNIMEGVMSDGRIAHAHTKVPGPDGSFGFGGTCLPKDIASLVYMLESNGLSANVTRGAHTRNMEDRKRCASS